MLIKEIHTQILVIIDDTKKKQKNKIKNNKSNISEQQQSDSDSKRKVHNEKMNKFESSNVISRTVRKRSF